MFSENAIGTRAWITRSILKGMALFSLGFSVLGLPTPGHAGPFHVEEGYDLLYTRSAYLDFQGAGGLNREDFVGQAFGRYDFGNGLVPTGNADTIVHRLSDATRPSNDAGPAIENPIGVSVDLTLRSSNPIAGAFGGGVGNYLLATVADSSGSTMSIDFDNTGLGGTFSSVLNLLIDLWDCQLNATGECVKQGINPLVQILKVFTLTDHPWSASPPSSPLVVLIPGVNYLLPDGTGNGTSDFFPAAGAVHDAGNGQHIVDPAAPEIDAASGAGALSLLAGVLALLGERRRKPA